MRTYYYRGITCPNCHEPHVNGGAIEILDENILKCTSCGAKFNKEVNLCSSRLFPKTFDYITEKEGENAENYLSHIPLVWKTKPNIIEQAYIDWLSSEKKGIFLITWPWRDVRFAPLLIFEYLLNNPKNRAVIIGNYSKNEEDKIEIPPPSPSVFTNMVYTVDAKSVNSEMKKESNKLSKKLVCYKEKMVEIKYKKIGVNESRPPKLCHKTLRICRNEILRDPDFGEGFLRKITEHKWNGESTTKEIDKNGTWDVTLDEQERWTGNLNYNKIWLWELFVNSTRLYPCKSIIPHLFDGYENNENLVHEDVRLHFLSSEPDFNVVLENVQEISPDILIIENADEIIADSRFGGEGSKALLTFLNDCSVKTVLMFSTNPDIRQFYKLNDNESVFHPIKVIPHTWDSPQILNSLPNKTESRYPNPISSNTKNLEEKNRKIIPEYIIVDSYSKIIETLDDCFSKLNDDLKRDLKLYFKRVFSTPLNIKGDYRDPEILLVNKWGSDSLTYDLVMSGLHEVLDQNIFISLNDMLRDTFQMDTIEQRNPLRNKIIYTIENILNSNDKYYITIVVYPFEIKGTERLLRKNDTIHDTAFSRISICRWKNLASIEGTIPAGFKHCVVSTCYPSIDYSLHLSSVNKFIFIGEKKGIEKIKDIIEKRVLEINAYPLIKPDANAALPDLLDGLLDMIEIPDKEQLSKLYEDVMKEMEFIMPYSEIIDSSGVMEISGESRTNLKIKTDESAILCIDSLNRGVFLPFNCSILIKDENQPYEISLKENSSLNSIKKGLVDKEIILGRSGFYISFRSIFFEFMMKFGDKLQFQRGPFEWNGFKNLFNDSVYWNTILEKAIHEYAENNSLDFQQSQNCIATALANSDITAINPDYIIGWWSNYEEITLDSGTYRLYKIEHPFTRNDMRTIFCVLENLCPGIVPDIQVADRSYAAAISLQNLRRNSLKGNIKNIDIKYSAIYSQFEKQIMQIIKNAELFQVVSVYKNNVSCEVEPLRIYENYQDFVNK
jgi:hypothetical protein